VGRASSVISEADWRQLTLRRDVSTVDWAVRRQAMYLDGRRVPLVVLDVWPASYDCAVAVSGPPCRQSASQNAALLVSFSSCPTRLLHIIFSCFFSTDGLCSVTCGHSTSLRLLVLSRRPAVTLRPVTVIDSRPHLFNNLALPFWFYNGTMLYGNCEPWTVVVTQRHRTGVTDTVTPSGHSIKMFSLLKVKLYETFDNKHFRWNLYYIRP